MSVTATPPPPTTRPATPLAPPPTPRGRPVVDEVGRPLVLAVLAVLAGLALDIGLRGGVTNAVVVIGGVLVLATVLVQPGVGRTSRWLTVLAAVPLAFLGVRASPWLASADVAAAGGLATLAIVLGDGGRLLDLSGLALVRRAWASTAQALHRVPVLARLVPRPTSDATTTAWRVVRAVAAVLPLLVVLVALLAGSDVVFAGLLLPDLDLGPVLGHVLLALLLASGVLLAALGVGAPVEPHERSGSWGAVEVAVVLGLAAVVLGLFVVSQGVAATDAGRRLVEESGLTPAEYARSGFFQLCWAAVVVVGYLALTRFLAGPGAAAARSVRALSAAVPLLATGLVAVSLRRMALYDDAFGLTMLRLAAVGATLWIGTVLVLLALRALGLGRERSWVPGAGVLLAVGMVVVANLGNPEAFVVRHNIARATAGADVDVEYLGRLSEDAVPSLADAAATATGPELAARLRLALVCDDPGTVGARRLNASRLRAERVREGHCPPAS